MKTLIIELKKEKRTGIILLMPTLGLLGGAYCPKRYPVKSTPGTYDHFADAALRYDHDAESVWHHRCRLYDLQHRIQRKRRKKNVCAAYTCSCHVPVQIFDSDHPAFRCRSTSKSGADSNRHYIFARRHI